MRYMPQTLLCEKNIRVLGTNGSRKSLIFFYTYMFWHISITYFPFVIETGKHPIRYCFARNEKQLESDPFQIIIGRSV